MTEIVRQSLDNLHDDITKDVLGMKRVVVDVIDPSPGIWGGEPVEGLVTVVYQCFCEWSPGCKPCYVGPTTGAIHTEHRQPETGHAHHALYGPTDEKDRQPGETVDRYSLYAD